VQTDPEDPWGVVPAERRLAWTFTPFERLGPLRFGMTHADVQAALRGVMACHVSQGTGSRDGWACFEFDREHHPHRGIALTVYYDGPDGLAAVAVDARRGPQVTLDGLPLTGRPPSRVLDDVFGQVHRSGHESRYNQQGDPGTPALGLVVRSQRAGDYVLTRPVLVARAWAEDCEDTHHSRIPAQEWHSF
jgi:hypothetical protein